MSKITVIGENLNSTNKKVKRILSERDGDSLLKSVRDQIEGSASFIDINASMLMNEEEDVLLWGARLVLKTFDTGVFLDSPNTEMLVRIIPELGSRAVLNSLTGDEKVLRSAIPVLADSGAGAVVMLKDKEGIPPTVRGRMELAERAASLFSAAEIPPERVYFDPLFLPVASSPDGARKALDTVSELKKSLPEYHRIGGLSNISYGLPMRKLLNRTFLAMAVSHGLTTLICDTTDSGLMEALKSSEAVYGLDPGCREFLQSYRAKKESR